MAAGLSEAVLAVEADPEARNAVRVLAGDRAELAALFSSRGAERDEDTFPRSATFRWIRAHLSGNSVAATGGALLLRMLVRRWLRTLH
jgi:hypothetical protein